MTLGIRLKWSSPSTRHTHTYCRALSSRAVTTCFYDSDLLRLAFEHPTSRLRGERSNPLRHRRGWFRTDLVSIFKWWQGSLNKPMRAIISPHKQPLPFLCAPRLEYSLKVQVCSKSPHQQGVARPSPCNNDLLAIQASSMRLTWVYNAPTIWTSCSIRQFCAFMVFYLLYSLLGTTKCCCGLGLSAYMYIWICLLLRSPCRKNYLPLRLLSGKVCIQLAKVRPWTFQSPPPPPLYILHAYLPPQMSCRLLEGGRIILSSNLSSMSGVWSWSKTWTIFAICTTVSSRVPIWPVPTAPTCNLWGSENVAKPILFFLIQNS